MSDLPAPFVPADVDLRDFPYLPLDIVRLFGSEFHALSTDAEWRAGVTLWLRSYHQVPAGSLPDDEIALTRLAELGRDNRSWRKISNGALRGWVKCSDGRLYHRTVSEKALEGWIEKLSQRKASEAGNAKRYGHPFDAAPLEAAIENSMMLLASLNPQSRALKKRASKAPTGTPAEAPGGGPDAPPTGSAGRSPAPPPVDLPHHSQEKRREGNIKEKNARVARDAFDRWYSGYPHKVGRGAAEKAFARVIATGEVTLDELIAATERYVRTKNPDHAWCNPATWLNQRRWLDQPAFSTSAASLASTSSTPSIDFGGGVVWPEPSVIGALGRWRADPSTWPTDRIGPPPGAPGCKVPDELLRRAA